MGSLGHVARYLFKMQLHGLGVGLRQGECSTCAASGTNSPENIGVGIALVGGLAWPCSASCPLPHDAVFLADAGFVLEPDFYRRINGHIFQMSFQGKPKVFL